MELIDFFCAKARMTAIPMECIIDSLHHGHHRHHENLYLVLRLLDKKTYYLANLKLYNCEAYIISIIRGFGKLYDKFNTMSREQRMEESANIFEYVYKARRFILIPNSRFLLLRDVTLDKMREFGDDITDEVLLREFTARRDAIEAFIGAHSKLGMEFYAEI